ncbi:ribosomal protein L21-like protein [Pyronema domesticum]|uniref:Large ribosomal subunit protein bL21m n=1 Tax=Pyronema omphalodes (strain CBS 100304) TaxID=1076935 RepID=U4LVZ6_PYROM|nr:ribosomal protein L21-like protein [Pyronema domesticum]CCX33001.1 Similar to Probable aconitate hydratase 2; acc. no. Q9P7D4 [Pyronema omphalodes CBS 100304]
MLQRILRPSVLRPVAALLRPATAAFSTASPLRNLAQETVAPATPAAPIATAPIETPAAVEADPSISLLPLLRLQGAHYITVHINGFPFLVTKGDQITLPFRLKGVSAGQTLKLTHASVLGSRDYTLKGNPYINPEIFSCKATVIEETAEPMRIKEKTKRRNRHVKKVRSKHSYTVVRIKELEVLDV